MLLALWDRLPFLGRLLVTASQALLVAGAAMLFVSARQESVEIKADLETELANELDTLPASLAEIVVIGDFATLQQSLDRQVARPSILTISFRDVTGTVLRSAAPDAARSDAPRWYINMFDFHDISGSAPVIIGGRSYGVLSLTLTTRHLVERSWQHLKRHIAILLLAVVLDFLGIWLVLRTSLAPLKQLELSADEMAAGHLDIDLSPRGSPELRHLIASFNRMAKSILTTQSDLKQSEERLQLAIRGANDGIWDWDIKRNKLYLSPRWKAILGYADDELVNEIDSLERNIHPGDKSRVLHALGDYLGGKSPVFAIEFRMRHKDGSWRWILGRAEALRDDQGTPYRMTGSHTDISERKFAEQALKQSEAKYRLIVDTATEGIWGSTSDSATNYVNNRMAELLGYSGDEMLGRPITDFLCEEDVASYDERAELLRQGQAGTYEQRFRRKDGEIIWALVSASPVFDDRGRFQGVFMMLNDITDRKRNEEELRRYKEHLEEEIQQRTADLVLARNAAEAANQAKSAFLANMSHELRTPLNAILGFSGMMRRDPILAESQSESLDIINRSGEHLLTLINDVLEMAKIEAGHIQLEDAPFDLGGMIRDVADMMQIRAQEKGLQLTIDQTSQFPRLICGDEARLRQVLINLLGNAIKFTQQGGVTLGLVARKNLASHLLIEVKDTGIGIAAEDHQRIFAPFEQLGDQIDTKGTGLGLTITRQFVELMGGSISLESEPGKGSVFRLDLPLKEAADIEIGGSAPARKGDVLGLAPGQPEFRILIVEDQHENRLLLTKLMESVGFKVRVAENGKRGIEEFRSWRPHLIWMDRKMPVMNGQQAARAIRQLPGGKDVKIIAVTASAFEEQRAEILGAGMDDFVRKPYRFDEIYDCLARQLGAEFSYQTDASIEVSAAPELTPSMLAALPSALREQLREALEILDSERIDSLIRQIGETDGELGEVLNALAESFDYPTILQALTADADRHGSLS